MRTPFRRPALLLALSVLLAVPSALVGCSSSPHPHAAETPPASAVTPPPATPTPDPEDINNAGAPTASEAIVWGGADSVGGTVGSQNAIYRYRFRQIFPASERFNFQDRDLSFYFRPTPGVLHFQIENRQGRPVFIDWEKSEFLDPIGRRGRVAHASTQFKDRFAAQSQTGIAGLQHYSDYLIPLDYLLDPAGQDGQPHQPLFREDQTALQFADREFGVDLAFIVEDQPRNYSFRFRVASVIPR